MGCNRCLPVHGNRRLASYTAAVATITSIVGAAWLLGLLAGSFLNVCIARLPRGESVVSPRSRCLHCGAAIDWYDNVPVLSYVLLRGKCRACGEPIGWHYPAVELLTALWFAVSFVPVAHLLAAHSPGDLLLSESIDSAALAVFGALLLALLVIDWKHQLLPDALTITGTVLGFLFIGTEAILLQDGAYDLVLKRRVNINSANAGRSTGNVFLTGPEHLVFGRLLAVVSSFLLLYLIGKTYKAIRKRDGMGLGDAKLLAMITSFLGFAPALLALFLGTMFATVYAVWLLARGKAGAATRLPFGSFLALGGFVAALAGTRMVEAYLALFR